MWPIYIIISFYILALILSLIQTIKENKKYNKLFEIQKAKICELNISEYIKELEELKKLYASNKILLLDRNGNIIVICTRCGKNMEVKKNLDNKTILECTDYPKCRSHKEIVTF